MLYISKKMELGLASAMLVCTSKMHSKCNRATRAVHVLSMPNDARQKGVGCFYSHIDANSRFCALVTQARVCTFVRNAAVRWLVWYSAGQTAVCGSMSAAC